MGSGFERGDWTRFGKTIEWLGRQQMGGRVHSWQKLAAESETIVHVFQVPGKDRYWMDLNYRIGEYVAEQDSLGWSVEVKYEDESRTPDVCIEGNTIVEVHQKRRGGLWYLVGVLDVPGATIDWGESIKYDKGAYPNVQMKGGWVIETHRGSTFDGNYEGRLYRRLGKVDPKTRRINWEKGKKYDYGAMGTIGW